MVNIQYSTKWFFSDHSEWKDIPNKNHGSIGVCKMLLGIEGFSLEMPNVSFENKIDFEIGNISKCLPRWNWENLIWICENFNWNWKHTIINKKTFL